MIKTLKTINFETLSGQQLRGFWGAWRPDMFEDAEVLWFLGSRAEGLQAPEREDIMYTLGAWAIAYHCCQAGRSQFDCYSQHCAQYAEEVPDWVAEHLPTPTPPN